MEADKSREQFEAWCRDRGHDATVYGDGNYADEVIPLREAWQASRQLALREAAEVLRTDVETASATKRIEAAIRSMGGDREDGR